MNVLGKEVVVMEVVLFMGQQLHPKPNEVGEFEYFIHGRVVLLVLRDKLERHVLGSTWMSQWHLVCTLPTMSVSQTHGTASITFTCLGIISIE